MDVGSTLVVVAIGSFAIDRIVSATLFLLSLPESWRRIFPDPDLVEGNKQKAIAAKQKKFLYFLFATLLTIPLVHYSRIGLFRLLGIPEETALQHMLDLMLTTLVFIGGADRIAALIKTHEGSPVEKSRPGAVEVMGSLTVEDGSRTPSVRCPSCAAELSAGDSFCSHCGTRAQAVLANS